MNMIDARTPGLVLATITLALTAGCNQSPSLTPPPQPTSYTLTVNTSNPATGVPIGVSYADTTGATNGTAGFTRTYNAGTALVLTAPTTAGGNLFSSWSG